MCVTVNVSARQFHSDSDLVHVIMSSLSSNRLPPDALQLELTEGLLLRETPRIREVMTKLADIGIIMLLDDFGTGYASLSYLQRYHFNSIKVDCSFISNILIDNDDARLVSAIIALAHSLDMNVVSEGVESSGQLEFLIDAGCHFVQGYLFSKPVHAERFEELFSELKKLSSTPGRLELATRS
jgi:EAL domain-containing protein (putative c-di-GMP-specific phosphodiesterase class I)